MANSVGTALARRAVWRHPTLRAILVAEGVSALGSQMSFVALPWFVLMANDRSATHMGLVLGAQLLPTALFGIPAAVVVQRIGVRRTLLIADLGRAPLLAAIPLLSGAGLLSFGALLGIVFAIGVLGTPYMSAARLAIPETLADDEPLVVQGTALLEGVVRFAMLLGPAVAGVAIAALGSRNVLYFDAISYLIAFLILRSTLPAAAPVHAGTGRAEGTAGVLAGARFALSHPILRRITAASLVFGIFFPPLIASLPVLTAQRYGEDPMIAGLLFSAMGAGALAGTLLVLPFADRVAPMRLGAIGAVGVAIPLWLLVVDLHAWQVGLVMLISGLFTPILNAPVIAQIMLRAPSEVRAKVLAFVLTANALAGPAAYALAGPALDLWGLTPVYVVIAVGVSIAAALMVTLAYVRTTAPPGATRWPA